MDLDEDNRRGRREYEVLFQPFDSIQLDPIKYHIGGKSLNETVDSLAGGSENLNCMNYQIWTIMIALGFNIAVSVRVSNELGANNPNAAKFSVIIAATRSAFVGLIFTLIALIERTQLPKLFINSPDLIKETSKLGFLLAATIFLNSIQTVLSGVSIGAGWQSLVAFINIGCHYIVGLPLGAVFGFKLKMNAMGIWLGVFIGVLQAVIMLIITPRTKWQKEAFLAEERIKTWGGKVEVPSSPRLQIVYRNSPKRDTVICQLE